MSVQSEVNRLNTAKADIKQAIINKGVSVSNTDKIDSYANKIAMIETPDANIYVGSTNPSSSLGSNGDIYLKI